MTNGSATGAKRRQAKQGARNRKGGSNQAINVKTNRKCRARQGKAMVRVRRESRYILVDDHVEMGKAKILRIERSEAIFEVGLLQ
jgi:urease gamma subunit